MKVMFFQLPHPYEGVFRPPSEYPLGIGYLVSVLKKDYELIPMDLWVNNSTIDFAVKEARKNIPDVFCISVYSTQYPYFKELVKELKLNFPDIMIIAGGPGATFSYKIILLNTEADICVLGEGELTLPELLKNLKNPQTVNGLAYLENNKVQLTPGRDQIKNLDDLPLPDREFFDIERYIQSCKREAGFLYNKRYTNVIAGRGCPYNCTYCSKTFNGCRIRSIESISREVVIIKEKYRLNAIEFNDELIILNKNRILELCRAIKKIGISWGCQGRINVIDEEILVAMKDAGCLYIGYGVESFSQKILDRMKKLIEVKDIISAIELTRKIGIKPVIQYMYGFPGEDDATISETKRFFKIIDHPFIGFTTTPLPGTVLYEEARQKGLIKDEEQYLTMLTAGYNREAPLVNMTGFTDEEFVLKKEALRAEIDTNYYASRPMTRLLMKLHRYIHIFKIIIFHPGKALKKIGKKLGNLWF